MQPAPPHHSTPTRPRRAELDIRELADLVVLAPSQDAGVPVADGGGGESQARGRRRRWRLPPQYSAPLPFPLCSNSPSGHKAVQNGPSLYSKRVPFKVACLELWLVKELAGCGSGQPNGEVSKVVRRGPPTDTNARRLGIGSARLIAREPQRQPADAGRAEQDQRRHDRPIGFDAQEWWRLRGEVSQMPSQTIAARPSGANKT